MQSTNFEFLRAQWPELADLGGYAEQYIVSDPASAQVKCRLIGERIAKLVCKKLRLYVDGQNFFNLLQSLQSKASLPDTVRDKLHTIRISGNTSAHGHINTSEHAAIVVQATFDVARWWALFNDVARANVPSVFFPIQQTATHHEQDQKQLQHVQELNEKLHEELELLRFQINSTAQTPLSPQVQDSANSLHFNESEARRFLIDTMLLEVGWDIKNPDMVGIEVPLLHQATASGKGYADYVLYDDDGTALAVIEAKRPGVDAKTGRGQAKDYANALQQQNKNKERPLIILTNGYENILIDDQGGAKDLGAKGYPDRNIYGIPAKESLSYRVRYQRDAMCNPAHIAHNPDIAGRPYQIEAIKAVAECFGEQYRRKALIVQATGTGKTRVAIAIAEVLMKAGYVKNILFLCDRKELRKQASKAFTNFMPHHKVAELGPHKNITASILLATYQGMMQRFQDYDIARFDLIIADESHRSIYNKFRDIFIYFDALQLGLTATPRNIVSHDTYKVFGCDDGDPTYYYEYEKAVAEKYLVDFKAISVTTKFLREGLDKDMLSAEEIKDLERDGIDVDELDVDPHNINSSTYIKGTNQAILRNLMENGLQDASQNGPGKSIIFARNIQHARLLHEWFQEMYPDLGADYCAVIHSQESRSESLIDNFKDSAKNPVIAISVDMLDTGIDIPEVLNLVFAKPVKSWVKFWQMIGRGTRLCENLLLDDTGMGSKAKEEFYIFDHWGNFEYFEGKSAEDEATPSEALLTRLFKARMHLAETSLKKYNEASFNRSIELVRAMLHMLPEDSLPIKEKLRVKNEVLLPHVLTSFSAATKHTLEHELAPLMRCVPTKGEHKAYAFDLLIAEIQQEILLQSAQLENLKAKLDQSLENLQTNIDAVKNVFPTIKALRAQEFWQQDEDPLLQQLEEYRTVLRGVMKYALDTGSEKTKTQIVNVDDKDVIIKEISSFRPSTKDMAQYRLRVRSVLEPHFETHPTLLKVRSGQPLQESDFDALLSLALTQSDKVNLEQLREFYSTTEELAKELRAIVGLNGTLVKERFMSFYQKYPNLSSLQTAFLNILQSQISQYGPITVEKLYEAPFIGIHSQGPDGIFKDEEQYTALIQIINTFEQLNA